MHADDLIINQPHTWQVLKHVTKQPPDLDAVPPLALIEKSVDTVHRRTLVIPSQQEKVIRILYFIGK